ncbi:MAG: hypothetical protein AAF585_15090 [Verrucomicrobiota bacterium]
MKIVFSSQFWPLLGAYLVATLMLSATGSVMGQLWLMFPVLGGLHLYVMHIIRGVPRDFADIFLGFKRNFGQLVILNLITYGPLMLLMIFPILLFYGGMFASINFSAPEDATFEEAFNWHPLLFVSIGVLILFQIIFWVAWILVHFSYQLCIDRLMSWKDSLRVSIGTAKKRFWKLLLFGIVSQIFMIVGMLACYVGVLVTVPIIMVANGLLFQDIWGTPTANGQPVPHSRSPGNSIA